MRKGVFIIMWKRNVRFVCLSPLVFFVKWIWMKGLFVFNVLMKSIKLRMGFVWINVGISILLLFHVIIRLGLITMGVMMNAKLWKILLATKI